MCSVQLQKEKKNQLKVNTVQSWNENYSCSFCFYDDYFTLWEPRISLGIKNTVKKKQKAKNPKPKTPPYYRSHL